MKAEEHIRMTESTVVARTQSAGFFTDDNSSFGVPEWGSHSFTKLYNGLTFYLSFDIISIISHENKD